MPSTSRLSQSVAIAASAIGLFCACGIGYHNNAPPPPPLATALSLSTSRLTFDTRAIDTHSPPQQIVVTNNGPAPLTLEIVPSPETHQDYDVDFKPCFTELAPGKSCTITVIFRPAAIGDCYKILHLHVTRYQDIWVRIHGVGVAPVEPKPPSP